MDFSLTQIHFLHTTLPHSQWSSLSELIAWLAQRWKDRHSINTSDERGAGSGCKIQGYWLSINNWLTLQIGNILGAPCTLAWIYLYEAQRNVSLAIIAKKIIFRNAPLPVSLLKLPKKWFTNMNRQQRISFCRFLILPWNTQLFLVRTFAWVAPTKPNVLKAT